MGKSIKELLVSKGMDGPFAQKVQDVATIIYSYGPVSSQGILDNLRNKSISELDLIDYLKILEGREFVEFDCGCGKYFLTTKGERTYRH